MDRAFSFRQQREQILEKNCLKRSKSFKNSKPFSSFSNWVSKSLKNFGSNKGKLPTRVDSKRVDFDGTVMYNSVYADSNSILDIKMESFGEKSEEIEVKGSKMVDFDGTVTCNSVYAGSDTVLEIKMESFDEKSEEIGVEKEGLVQNEDSSILEIKMESFIEKSEEIEVEKEGLVQNEEECRDTSSNSEFVASEENGSLEDSSSTPSMGQSVSSHVSDEIEKPQLCDSKLQKQGSSLSEIDMMKERFAKLLLGEDMSGCGNGVCTALAISNAITNLCATIFGQIWRLEPLPVEKKLMWRREMEWLLSVSDHIVELIPSWQTFPDGSKLEVMTSMPRSDLYVNLPALRKLDNMLLETLDSFDNVEFWYVDQGIIAPEPEGSSSFRKLLPHQEDKWWLPVPRVPINGLSEDTRKDIQYRRDSTNQILKAAMAINSNTLAEMEVPESYLEALPKNARASLGDIIHRYICSDQFSTECLLECLDLSSEHQALEIANRVEASIYIWRRRIFPKPLSNSNRSSSKSSWDMVKDLVIDVDKREQLGDRAETLLLCLKQRFPGLPQTTLDMSKIQFNKDVGKSILESYSRVLESLAFNIISRIDDLLYVDDLTKHSDQSVSISKVGIIPSCKSVGIPLTAPVTGTPYKTALNTPNFSPAKRISPAKAEKSQSLVNKNSQRGFGMKKILTDYLMTDSKVKTSNKEMRRSGSLSSTSDEISASQSSISSECSKETSITETHDITLEADSSSS
ncbi:hypothetical protein Leryth_011138 [Lithospermum erythrorhizon]|nr:hypothetical protein Leryth_011138 [Lithospermum erythrorhizon]